MKKNLLLVVSYCAFINLSAQVSRSFNLKCILPPGSSGTIYLSYPGSDKWIKDSCRLTNNQAVFHGSIPSPVLGQLSYNNKDKEVFLEPASMTLTVSDGNFSQGRMTGSKTQHEFDELNRSIQKINDRWKIVLDTVKAVGKRSNTAFQELKAWALVPYFVEIEEANLDFFSRYPTSFVTAYTLRFVGRDLSTDSLKLFYNRLPAVVKQSIYGKDIKDQLEKRKLGAVGTMAAVFRRPDVQGDTLALVDLRGKYVLLDFWASWCVPCRKGNPHLIKLYEQYKARGLEIIGIADDEYNPAAWRKAIEDDHLPWHQILSGKSPDIKINHQYNVIYLPVKVLIDTEGKIIGRYGEDMDELDKMLERIFR